VIRENFPDFYRFLWKVRRLTAAGWEQINIVRMEDLVKSSLKLIEQIPNDFDVIIGVPRAGLMIANIIACKFGRPLSTPENFARNESWTNKSFDLKNVKRVLIVDDDVYFGNALSKAIQKVKIANSNVEIETASLFTFPKSKKKVNYFLQTRHSPALYEWNILNVNSRQKLVTDMDGVLCKDYTGGDYENWIRNVKPHYIPQYEIDAIVTARLEKYRALTEEWLSKYTVKYKDLFMMPLQDEKKRSFERVIDFKVQHLRHLQPFWYWESNYRVAEAIKKCTKIPILCTDRMVLLN
jgi:hypoxanthine phosphoribosyltransferase